MAEIVRCRVKYLTKGLVLGTREFIEKTYSRYRESFGLQRADGCRPMKELDCADMFIMKDLRGKSVLLE